MRYELPPDLSPEEERAAIAALEQYFGARVTRPSPWALAGRAEALRLGALQTRHQADVPWQQVANMPHARRWIEPRAGRMDTR
jgi:hypothetical protein